MSRIKINPPQTFRFSTVIAIRITDLNYGGHVGNNSFLSIVHEARMQFLKSFGYTELAFGGVGLIMRDMATEFLDELFYGETVTVWVAVDNISAAGFDIFYKLEKNTAGGPKLAAIAKTGMVTYDYSKKKVAPFPEEAKSKFQAQNV
jgi:acyl-CoA thioester hydrolase